MRTILLLLMLSGGAMPCFAQFYLSQMIRVENASSLINDSITIQTKYKEGICLANIENRGELLSTARHFNNTIDNFCYQETSFFLLPVELSYKMKSLDHHVLPCEKPITIKVYKQNLVINYSMKDIKIKSIKKNRFAHAQH